jgi:hypothetical protein
MTLLLQLEEKRRPEAGLCLHPVLALVPAEDALRDCQADADPRRLALTVQALEGTELPVRIRRVETERPDDRQSDQRDGGRPNRRLCVSMANSSSTHDEDESPVLGKFAPD